jgi:hypothetical protein
MNQSPCIAGKATGKENKLLPKNNHKNGI